MAKLRVSAEARRDLERIGAIGVEEHGPVATAAYLEGFRRFFGLLGEQPYAGQARPELGPDIRSLSHRPYRLLYRLDGDTVIIDRIIHQARDVGRALREEQ